MCWRYDLKCRRIFGNDLRTESFNIDMFGVDTYLCFNRLYYTYYRYFWKNLMCVLIHTIV